MKRIILIASMAFASVASQATVITAYNSRVEVEQDGAATVQTTIKLSEVQAGRIILPVGFTALDNLQLLNNPVGVVIKPVVTKNQTNVEVDLASSVVESLEFTFSFKAPDVLGQPKEVAGEKSKLAADTSVFRHTFVNTQELPISRYQLEVWLPKGQRIQRITEQTPKPKRTEALPRVRLTEFDGHHQGATLQISNLKQGDRTSMALDVVEEGRSFGWLIAGVAISLAYLVGFRDLVKKSTNA
jgi:hypothetical protein